MSDQPKTPRKPLVGPASQGETGLHASAPAAAPEATPRRLRAEGHDAETTTFVTVGQVLSNHYKLTRELGRGGMGVVFEADDVKLEGRRVAVKVLPPELSRDQAAVVRLKREASAVATLEHPNVVRLYEYNDDVGISYVVMELLDGENLGVYLAKQGKLPLDEVLAIGREVAQALDFAHAKSLIHRDVKPSNLMFKTDGGQRAVKVADFGIAHQVRDSVTRATGHEVAGTLLYLAPELLRGKKASPASDQYSFAVTLYELLAGDPPFTGQGLSQQILDGEPEPVPGVPPAVNAALRRALSKLPEERFPSCRALVEALEGKGAPAPAVVPSPKPGASTATWVVAALVLVLAFLGLFDSRPAPPATQLVVAPSPTPSSSLPTPSPSPLPSASPAVSVPFATPVVQALPVATSAATAPARPASTVRGAIHAKSVPPGAAVWLDGKDTGIVTNNLLSDVELGRHQVTLRLADHEPVTTEVEVDDTKVAPHSVTLTPSKVRLTVSSDPDGAQVFLDDARREGVTPCFVPDVPCGTHRLRLEKGDLFFEGDVRVTMAAPTVQQKLAPREVRVSFKSTPPGAKVYCDALGLKGERVTPFEQPVRVGEYQVSFVAKGYRKSTVTVRPGDAQGSEVAAKLEPEQATVRIVVSPKDARVTVNGKAADAASLASYPVSPGEVRVVATRSGYQTASQTLNLADRDAKPVTLTLAETPKNLENSLGMKLVWLAPGTFQMGSPDNEPDHQGDESPVHAVRITRGFWIGATEVTQSEWEAVIGANPSNFKGSRLPVEKVSWEDCQDFCRKLTEREQSKGTLPQGSVYRLPTEAEWEYACRAGTTGARYGELDSVAWYDKNSGSQTHDVGQKRANAWGLYDMLGNVWEWCADGPRSYSAAAQTDPMGPSGGNRVLRGGSWGGGAKGSRAALRSDGTPADRGGNGGCRVVVGAPVRTQ